jgi:haloalkane dehalogenase
LSRAAAGEDAGCRWVALDLIGMGGSGKPELDYRLVDHIAYVDAFVEALGLSNLVLVGHDWGVAIAVDRLRRRAGDVRAVAFMEGHLRPLPGWDSFDAGGRQLFQQLRTPRTGEQLVLEENFFLDTLLPAALTRALIPTELGVYQAPYVTPASRRPLLQWAREIPVGGEPADVARLMAAAVSHLQAVTTPTLLVHGEPGVLVTEDTVDWCRRHLANLTVCSVGGPAGHFLPEDRPDEVADALLAWVAGLP